MSLSEKLRGHLQQVTEAVGPSLMPGDAAVLASYAPLERDQVERVRSELKRSQKEICGAREGKSASALEAEFSRGITKVEHESDEYYRLIMDSLSSEGRAKVMEYLNEHLFTDDVVQTRFDTVALARDKPELVMSSIEAVCAQVAGPPASIRPNDSGVIGTVVR